MKQKLEVSQEEVAEIIKNTRKLSTSERPVFLYLKQHNITGLLYFGTTIQEPYNYSGSGEDWGMHLKNFGNDTTTIWLRKFENCDDPKLKKMARRISKELNIVESEKFANKCIELGSITPKKLPSYEYLHECFIYNSDGTLTWKTRPVHHFNNVERIWKMWNTSYQGTVAGYISNKGYNVVKLDKKCFMVHRIIWKFLNNEEPSECIDHKDGNRLNNKIENLRKATYSENNKNSKIRKDNTSGYKCIHFNKKYKKFIVMIGNNYEYQYYGWYDTEEEAYAVYCENIKEIHGEFSNVG